MGKRIKAEKDRISNLPESILGNILSFLSLKQAAQTSILSKTWRQVWRSCPVVDFDAGWLFSLARLWNKYDSIDREECLWRRQKLLDGLEKFLEYRVINRISMKRFTVFMWSSDSEFVSFVDRCVSYAVLGGVKELKLDGACSYDLPQMVLSAESIQVLKLADCRLDSSSSNVKLPSLKKLHLLCVSADDDLINDLISKCPLIEDLSFKSCSYKSIKISSPNIKSLNIENCPDVVEVKIVAAKLSKFRYRGKIASFDFNYLALIKCNLCFWAPEDISFQWKAKYSELLAKFHKFSKMLKISGDLETAIVPREIRRSLPSPLYGVKHLKFCLLRGCKYSSAFEVLDGLLWRAPHAETISIKSDAFFWSFKFWYKKPMIYYGRTPQCCKLCPLPCWQQCIQHVLIEIGYFQRYVSAETTVMRRYLFKGEEIPRELAQRFRLFMVF